MQVEQSLEHSIWLAVRRPSSTIRFGQSGCWCVCVRVCGWVGGWVCVGVCTWVCVGGCGGVGRCGCGYMCVWRGREGEGIIREWRVEEEGMAEDWGEKEEGCTSDLRVAGFAKSCNDNVPLQNAACDNGKNVCPQLLQCHITTVFNAGGGGREEGEKKRERNYRQSRCIFTPCHITLSLHITTHAHITLLLPNTTHHFTLLPSPHITQHTSLLTCTHHLIHITSHSSPTTHHTPLPQHITSHSSPTTHHTLLP